MSKSVQEKPIYDESLIVHLEGAEAIRQNVGMYVGNAESHGYHQLASEVIDNGIDEAMAGHATSISTIIKKDGSLSIEDNGRGIPSDPHPVYNISTLQVALTKIHAGGKFEKQAYAMSGGLHGVGLKATNALSEWLEATIYRNGNVYYQKYQDGKPLADVKTVGSTTQHGTRIHFKPSKKIYRHVEGFEQEWFLKRLRDLSYLNPGVELLFEDQRVEPVFKQRFFQTGGLKSYVESLVTDTGLLKEAFFMSVLERDGQTKDDGSQDEMRIEAAFTYENSDNETSLCFANNIFNRDGGAHLSGFQAALTYSFNAYLKNHPELISKKEQKELGGKPGLRGEDYRQGLIAIISVRLARPTFQSQTKDRLTNVETQHAVRKVVQAALDKWIEENPAAAKKVLEKAILNFRAHLASKQAAETVKKDTKSLLGGNRKLKDCTEEDPEKTELFIVEGDSAAGTAIDGRDYRYQAILALGGKILNTWKAPTNKMLAHEELSSLIKAVGTGILDTFDAEKCRYSKIIIMCDADIDGLHIRTLLLTFFFQRMRKLIEDGRIYIAQPPLYRVQYLYKDDKCSKCKGVKSKKLAVCPICSGTGKLTEYITYDEDFYPAMSKLGLENAVLSDLAGTTLNIEDIFNDCKEANIAGLLAKGFKKEDLQEQQIDGNPITRFHLKNGTKAKAVALACLLDLPQAAIELGQNSVDIMRYKGLGEMSADSLYTSTMDVEKRVLIQVTLNDAVHANEMFELLMGGKAELRREFITKKKAY